MKGNKYLPRSTCWENQAEPFPESISPGYRKFGRWYLRSRERPIRGSWWKIKKISAMELVDAPPMDEKAKRTRDLLASFYAQDSSASSGSTISSTGTMSYLDSINSSAFDPDKYMNLLVTLQISFLHHAATVAWWNFFPFLIFLIYIFN